MSNATGQVMPMIAVESVDPIRDFYVDKLGFQHVMGMIGKDGQLDFVHRGPRRRTGDVLTRACE